jgi:hypothetical protein
MPRASRIKILFPLTTINWKIFDEIASNEKPFQSSQNKILNFVSSKRCLRHCSKLISWCFNLNFQ